MQAREDIVTDYWLERKEGKDNKEVNVVASPTSVQAAYLAIKEMKCLKQKTMGHLHEHFPMQKAT